MHTICSSVPGNQSYTMINAYCFWQILLMFGSMF